MIHGMLQKVEVHLIESKRRPAGLDAFFVTAPPTTLSCSKELFAVQILKMGQGTDSCPVLV